MASTLASMDKSPLDDMVRNLKPQRLERTLTEVQDWLAGGAAWIQRLLLASAAHSTRRCSFSGQDGVIMILFCAVDFLPHGTANSHRAFASVKAALCF
jgi:hypothetical protein